MSLRKLFKLKNVDDNNFDDETETSMLLADEQQKKFLKNDKKTLRLAAGGAVLLLFLTCGIVGYSIHRHNKINQEKNNPIYDQFESEEFKNVLTENQYQIDYENNSEIFAYLKNINKNIIKYVLRDANLQANDAQLMGIEIINNSHAMSYTRGNGIEVWLKCGNKDVFAHYYLDLHMARDISKLLMADDAKVRAKLPAFISELIENPVDMTCRSYEFAAEELFYDFSDKLNQNGINVNAKNFFIRSVTFDSSNPYSSTYDKAYVGFGYLDDNIASYFSIACKVRNENGKLKIEAADEASWVFQNLSAEFSKNSKGSLSITKYFYNPSLYDENTEGLDDNPFAHDYIQP